MRIYYLEDQRVG